MIPYILFLWKYIFPPFQVTYISYRNLLIWATSSKSLHPVQFVPHLEEMHRRYREQTYSTFCWLYLTVPESEI